MSAPTSPARRRAFLRAVAETGNQTLAAERAKVSRSWVQLHRQADPAFRAAVDAAIAQARERLKAAHGVGPEAKWRALAGEELAVTGTNGRRVQVRRANPKQWTPRLEARFCEALARSANVHAACAAVGLSVPSAYNHRHRWDDFARRWDRSVEFGQVRLEAALLAAGRRCLDPAHDRDTEPLDIPITGMTAVTAIQLLRLRGNFCNRCKGPIARPPKAVPSEAIGAVVMKAIARVQRVSAAGLLGDAAGSGLPPRLP